MTYVIAGIDTHKDTLAVAVVDDSGRLVAGGDVPNTERGFAQLVDMFTAHRVQRVGIEGSGSFGRPARQRQNRPGRRIGDRPHHHP